MARLTSVTEALKSVTGGDFILVEYGLDGPRPVYGSDGQLLCFKDGERAEAEASRLTYRYGGKIQPRRAVDKNWREREALRMSNGSYTQLPWHKEKWWGELEKIHKDHFPHVALQKTALISFTEDEAKGSADVQTVIKPGRYLERYYKDVLDTWVIRDLCCIFAKNYEDNKLQFAETADEMEEVFMEGPSSCMSKEAKLYGTKEHPVRMYAAGDLVVAYMRRNGRIVARCVAWPEKKTFNTVYGDAGRLHTLLEKEGYRKSPPVGARLRKVKDRHEGNLYRYICPHLDNIGFVVDGGDVLIAGDPSKKDPYKSLEVGGGGGISELLGYVCEFCKTEGLCQRSIKSFYKGVSAHKSYFCCKDCQKQLITCSLSGSTIEKEHAVQMDGGKWGWRHYVNTGQLTLCQGSGVYAATSSMIVMPDGKKWSNTWFMKHGKCCNKCGGAMAKADKICPRCS